jgi:hypothetical protein
MCTTLTQVAGGKSTVWQYTQDWINAIYGSPEAAAAAGYVPFTVRAGGSDVPPLQMQWRIKGLGQAWCQRQTATEAEPSAVAVTLQTPTPRYWGCSKCQLCTLQVEDVLDAREWDQYKDMIDELRGLIKEPDARTPGSAPFKRILQLHTAISKVAKIKARHLGAWHCRPTHELQPSIRPRANLKLALAHM